jgi:uncharacterized cupredoxin-like copper-binding protein
MQSKTLCHNSPRPNFCHHSHRWSRLPSSAIAAEGAIRQKEIFVTPFAHIKVVALAAGLSIVASQAFAASIIKVVEDGEGGGKMSLQLDPATVKAGPATFQVTNHAATEDHEMIVVRLKSADQKIPFIAAKNRVDEKKLKNLGEVEDIKPSASGELKVTLKEGTYLVFCNIKGHYEAGMQSRLTVTK